MSDGFRGLRLYNTLTRTKEDFVPIDPSNVRMYVCGPTVYDYAHIGNARPAIVFDVLFRLLRHLYGPDHVTYVRNITDVDDKINARALRDYGKEIEAGRLSLNEAIRKVTEPTYEQYQKDVTALGCLPPTHQPRATEHIEGMIAMIQTLLDRDHAYVAQGAEGRETLFDIRKMAEYGQLSGRKVEDQLAGARVEAKDHKRNPGDFVLWKESSNVEPGWDASFRISDTNRDELRLNSNIIGIRGRPGWHIECSVMSKAFLGEVFDIHGGGLDLIFPHHENEIAQSRCAHGTEVMANYWLHNGFLQVEGKKMSKSEGNFVTIHELLETGKFGGRTWPGEVLRLAMLMTHYREPIDFSVRRLEEAEGLINKWTSTLLDSKSDGQEWLRHTIISMRFTDILFEDLNTPLAVNELHKLHDWARRFRYDLSNDAIARFRLALNLLGFGDLGRNVENSKSGMLDEDEIERSIAQRLAFITQKDWPEADRIRDELLAQGIQLKDGKDPATGDRITTWEVKR